MKKFFRLILLVAMIFFALAENSSAEPVSISNDNLQNFIEKCNSTLKAGNPDSFLDVPNFAYTDSDGFSNYVDDTIKTEKNIPIKITYLLKDEKIFLITIESGKFDENVKTYFDFLGEIFLKSSGLTDGEVRGLINSQNENYWQRDGFISRLNKKIIVTFYENILLIGAEEK